MKKTIRPLAILLYVCIIGCKSDLEFTQSAANTIENEIFNKSPEEALKGVETLNEYLTTYSDGAYCDKSFGDEFFRLQAYKVSSDGYKKTFTIVSEIKVYFINKRAKIVTIDSNMGVPSFMKGGKEVGEYKGKIIKELNVNGAVWFGIFSANENSLKEISDCSDVKFPTITLANRIVLTNDLTAIDHVLEKTFAIASMML